MEFHEILAQLRKKQGLTQHEVAEYLCTHGSKITHKAISKWEKGATSPDANQMLALCALYGVRDVLHTFLGKPVSGLLEGLNEQGRQRVREYAALLRTNAEFSDALSTRLLIRRVLPFYDLPASAGQGLFLDSDHYEQLEVGEDVPKDADFALRISGDSMLPRYTHAQVVYVKRQNALNVGEIGIFALGGDAYCKQLGHGELLSLNPAYLPIPIHEGDELRVLGRVLS